MTELILAYFLLSRLFGFRWQFMETRIDWLMGKVRAGWAGAERIRLVVTLALVLQFRILIHSKNSWRGEFAE